MRKPRATSCLFAVALCGGAVTSGCERLRELAPALPNVAILPGHHQRSRAQSVRPTLSAARPVTVVVEDERTLGSIARGLGVTVEDIISTNKLSRSQIHAGQRLRVRAMPELYARFLAERQNRKTRRAARLRKLTEKRRTVAMKALRPPHRSAHRHKSARSDKRGPRHTSAHPDKRRPSRRGRHRRRRADVPGSYGAAFEPAQ